MKIILLERVLKLGQMGDIVTVKDGYARNYLLPTKKALRATKANNEYFDKQKVQLEAHNLELKKDAEGISEKLKGKYFMAIRQSADSGQLYGSVTTRDIAKIISDAGFSITRNQVNLDRPVKTSGIHDVRIVLHPEVIVIVHINIARSDDEALMQEKEALNPEDKTEIAPEPIANEDDKDVEISDEAQADDTSETKLDEKTDDVASEDNNEKP